MWGERKEEREERRERGREGGTLMFCIFSKIITHTSKHIFQFKKCHIVDCVVNFLVKGLIIFTFLLTCNLNFVAEFPCFLDLPVPQNKSKTLIMLCSRNYPKRQRGKKPVGRPRTKSSHVQAVITGNQLHRFL